MGRPGPGPQWKVCVGVGNAGCVSEEKCGWSEMNGLGRGQAKSNLRKVGMMCRSPQNRSSLDASLDMKTRFVSSYNMIL